jgi:hypothetical protein
MPSHPEAKARKAKVVKSNGVPKIRSKGGKRTISTRQLAKHTSIVMGELAEGGGPLIVTREGVPFARLVLLSDEDEHSFSAQPNGEKQA